MFFLGPLVNAIAVLIGGTFGTFVGDRIQERFKQMVMSVLPLAIVIMGIDYALKYKNYMVVILSLVIGGLLGEAINIDSALDKLGKHLEKKFSHKNGFSEGFITSTLVFCIGSMAIVGSLQSGLSGNNNTLYIKSILDGITSIIFASGLGIGVCFSFFSILVYEGMIAATASWISPYISGAAMKDIIAVGGVIIVALSLDLLNIKKFKVANMLPAVVLPVIYYLIIR